MQELVSQLGLDWKLLLSQGANFLIVVGVLTALVYRPLLKILKERREKIELGVKAGEMAEVKLAEIETERNTKLKEIEVQAISIVRASEDQAKKKAEEILGRAEEKSEGLIKNAQEIIDQKEKEALKVLDDKAVALVKEALVKTVLLKPEEIDEKLIGQAISDLKTS